MVARATESQGRELTKTTASASYLPAVLTQELAHSAGDGEAGLRRYLAEVRQMPYLEAEEERLLAVRWREKKDRKAAGKLVTSHLRLVARLALGYRGYGLPLSDLVSEGTLGLLRAVDRFDPERRVRLSTYASLWIRASIQEYILRSWSLVKMGSGAEQKRLFFRLRQERNKLLQYEQGARTAKLAEILDVDEESVREMEGRLDGRDFSLDTPIATESGESGGSWLERIEAGGLSPEEEVAAQEEQEKRARLLQAALANLPPREREILLARRLAEPPQTLAEVAETHKISGERVRQIEKRAFELLKRELLQLAGAQKMLAHDPNVPTLDESQSDAEGS